MPIRTDKDGWVNGVRAGASYGENTVGREERRERSKILEEDESRPIREPKRTRRQGRKA